MGKYIERFAFWAGVLKQKSKSANRKRRLKCLAKSLNNITIILLYCACERFFFWPFFWQHFFFIFCFFFFFVFFSSPLLVNLFHCSLLYLLSWYCTYYIRQQKWINITNRNAKCKRHRILTPNIKVSEQHCRCFDELNIFENWIEQMKKKHGI